MSIVKTERVSLSDYLLKDRVLLVPPWQREYKWGSGGTTNKDQVNRLLEDLDEFALSSADQYFMGLLTLTRTNETIEGRKVNFIVDGQQRTVTMQIFLMCCYEYLSRKNDAKIPIAEAGLYSTLEELISFPSRLGAPSLRVRFSQSGANTALEIIHTWMRSGLSDKNTKDKLLEESPSNSKTMENLLEVRRFFSEELENYDDTGKCKWFGGDIISALKKIISGLTFIELEISDEQEAMDIYGKMNNRGMSLDSADLIKNQLFANVADEKAFDSISDHWNSMTELLRGHKTTRFKEPVFLVRSYAGMLWGKSFREKELASKFGGFLSEGAESSYSDPDPIDFISELRNLAEETVHLCSEHTNYPLLHAAQRIGAVQHFPLLLAGTYLKSEKLRSHFYAQVGARAILQVLSKEHPPHVENIYPAWAHEVFLRRDTSSIEELDTIYRNFAYRRGDANADEIENYKQERLNGLNSHLGLLRYNIGSHRRRIAFILALTSWYLDQFGPTEHSMRISDYLSMRSHDPSTERLVRWEIDHIAANAYADERISDELRQSLGNLVLLNYKRNRGAGNGSPESKKDSYTIKSSLTLTKFTDFEVLDKYKKDLKDLQIIDKVFTRPWDLNNWTDTSIENRTLFIQGLMQAVLGFTRIP